MFKRKDKQIRRIAFVQNNIMTAILEEPSYFSIEDIKCKVEERIKFSYYGKYSRKHIYLNLDQLIQMAIYQLEKYNLLKYDTSQQKYIICIPATITYIERN